MSNDSEKIASLLNHAYSRSKRFRSAIDGIGGLHKTSYSKSELQTLAVVLAETVLLLEDNARLLLDANQQLQRFDRVVHAWANNDQSTPIGGSAGAGLATAGAADGGQRPVGSVRTLESPVSGDTVARERAVESPDAPDTTPLWAIHG